MQKTVVVNLNEIARNQSTLLSRQHGAIKTAAEIYSKGDAAKAEKVLQDVGKYAGQYLRGGQKTDTADGS